MSAVSAQMPFLYRSFLLSFLIKTSTTLNFCLTDIYLADENHRINNILESNLFVMLVNKKVNFCCTYISIT
ncbi:hypothetical protein ACT3QO_11105, partial [Psychrobacter sp. AOP7-D1-15]|uniref:hypothetical protein n=1 Tax=unclassified Psychrobacter TaxID=196806 RepID=UPI00402BEE82